MKKIVSLIICFNLFLPSFAYISDDFAESSLDKNLKIQKKSQPLIKDELTEFLQTDAKKREIGKALIIDEFAQANKNISAQRKVVVIDENLPVLKQAPARKYVSQISESIAEEGVPVKIRTGKKISTRNCPDEGEYVDFITVEDLTLSNKAYPAGTIVKGRIETVSKNYSQGVPADIVIGNFYIDDKPLYGEIKKIGANRSLWVKPVGYILTPVFFAGLFILPIRGGHAKVRMREVYTVFYQ